MPNAPATMNYTNTTQTDLHFTDKLNTEWQKLQIFNIGRHKFHREYKMHQRFLKALYRIHWQYPWKEWHDNCYINFKRAKAIFSPDILLTCHAPPQPVYYLHTTQLDLRVIAVKKCESTWS